MARRQIGNPLGVVVKAGAQVNKQSGGGAAGTVVNFDPATTDDISSMRTALQTGFPSVYTNERLANMTYNDLVFAYRRDNIGSSPVFNAVK